MFEILLCEDDRLQVKLIEYQIQALKRAGEGTKIHLNHARDGLEAKDYLHQSLQGLTPRPHLILLDLNMPRMGGQQFLEWLRHEADLEIRRIPVIVLTTSESEEDALKAYEHLIAAFIPKPPGTSELGNLLKLVYKLWAEYSIWLPKLS